MYPVLQHLEHECKFQTEILKFTYSILWEKNKKEPKYYIYCHDTSYAFHPLRNGDLI